MKARVVGIHRGGVAPMSAPGFPGHLQVGALQALDTDVTLYQRQHRHQHRCPGIHHRTCLPQVLVADVGLGPPIKAVLPTKSDACQSSSNVDLLGRCCTGVQHRQLGETVGMTIAVEMTVKILVKIT